MINVQRLVIIASFILTAGCVQRATIPSEFFPLAEGSEYTYRGVFSESGKQVQDVTTLVVRSHDLKDGTRVFYFIDTSGESKENTIIKSNMIGLGAYLFDDGDLWTIEAFWKEDLQLLDSLQKQQFLRSPLSLGSTCKLTGYQSNPVTTVVVESFEDVTVAAGDFQECMKLSITTKWDSGKEYVSFAWLARGVGLIKWRKGTGRVEELVEYHLK